MLNLFVLTPFLHADVLVRCFSIGGIFSPGLVAKKLNFGHSKHEYSNWKVQSPTTTSLFVNPRNIQIGDGNNVNFAQVEKPQPFLPFNVIYLCILKIIDQTH